MFTKEIVISFLKSFLSNLVGAVIIAVGALPEGTLLEPTFWKAGGATALLFAVIRSALSETWKKVATEKFGGKRK